MTNLRDAASAGKPKYDISNPEDSSYRKRLIELLQGVDPGFQGERLERVLVFFNPEWTQRDQVFLRRFSQWVKRAPVPDFNDMTDLVKYGSSNGSVGVHTIANNLQITFEDALFRSLALVAIGLAHRGAKTPNGLQIKFSPASRIQFVLGCVALEKFTDGEVHRLADFFYPELDAGKPQFALRTVAVGCAAIDQHESSPEFEGLPIQDMLTAFKEADDFIPIGSLAKELEVSTGLATFTLLVVAAAVGRVERQAPFFTEKHGGTSLLRVRATGEVEGIPFDEDEVIEMGKLPLEEHRAILEGDLGNMPREMAQEAFEMAQDQADPSAPVEEEGDTDDLQEVFGEFETRIGMPVSLEPTRKEMIEMMGVMEDRIQAAEDLAQRVGELENTVQVLQNQIGPQVEAIIQRLGVVLDDDEPADPEVVDTAIVIQRTRELAAKEASAIVAKLGASYMPTSRRNNRKLRQGQAERLAEAILLEMGIEPADPEDDYEFD